MKNKYILVIEDNELNVKLLRGILTPYNYRIIAAEDAETGIQLAREDRPDIILMDIQLPCMNGMAATRIIKNDMELKDIPVIALTSFAMDGDKQRAKEAGFDAYITKPIDKKLLLKTIEQYIKQ